MSTGHDIQCAGDAACILIGIRDINSAGMPLTCIFMGRRYMYVARDDMIYV